MCEWVTRLWIFHHHHQRAAHTSLRLNETGPYLVKVIELSGLSRARESLRIYIVIVVSGKNCNNHHRVRIISGTKEANFKPSSCAKFFHVRADAADKHGEFRSLIKMLYYTTFSESFIGDSRCFPRSIWTASLDFCFCGKFNYLAI